MNALNREIVNLMPNIEDFTELNEDYEGSLDVFMAWDSASEILDVGSRAPHG